MRFQYTIDQTADEPVMLINKHIGHDDADGEGIMGAQFQAELLTLDTMGKKRIQLWINSPGGSVMDGMNIRSAILRSKTPVDTYCVGVAASEAANIFQAGRKRTMADYAFMMIHNPFQSGAAEADAEAFRSFRDSIVITLSARSGKSKEEVISMMEQQAWLSASECFLQGFCDEIEVSHEQEQPTVFPQTNIKSAWCAYNNALNQVLNKAKPYNMLRIANKLMLPKDANEDSIIRAITAMENRAQAAEALLANTKTQLCKAQEELDAAQQNVNELKEQQAITEVSGFANSGRIKNDASVIKQWAAKWLTDPEGVKAMLEALPLNKTAIRINDETEMPASVYGAAGVMINIANKNNQLK
ncbi:MAG: Clp protease ClpP [Sphingobacteriales bacterium]|nr:MAG: Clp protease ClpP [Sphingobacteriales bacterium]